jgi:hypothetical protein
MARRNRRSAHFSVGGKGICSTAAAVGAGVPTVRVVDALRGQASAVVYITQSVPQSITWLSIADAKRLGIEVSPLDSAASVPAQTPARTPPVSPAAIPSQLWQVP